MSGLFDRIAFDPQEARAELDGFEFWLRSHNSFGEVEFEDGRNDSIFKGGPSQYRHWSNRLEHGFGQVIDWAWLKQSHAQSPLLRSSFGGRIAADCYVVVCGRSPAGGSLEEERFDFRRRIGLTGIDFQLFTYDDMINAMRDNVTVLTAV